MGKSFFAWKSLRARRGRQHCKKSAGSWLREHLRRTYGTYATYLTFISIDKIKYCLGRGPILKTLTESSSHAGFSVTIRRILPLAGTKARLNEPFITYLIVCACWIYWMVNLIYSPFDFCESRFLAESYVKSRREIKLSFAHICIRCESPAPKVSHSPCPNILIGRTVNSANKEPAEMRYRESSWKHYRVCYDHIIHGEFIHRIVSTYINRKYNFNDIILLCQFDNTREFEFMTFNI